MSTRGEAVLMKEVLVHSGETQLNDEKKDDVTIKTVSSSRSSDSSNEGFVTVAALDNVHPEAEIIQGTKSLRCNGACH